MGVHDTALLEAVSRRALTISGSGGGSSSGGKSGGASQGSPDNLFSTSIAKFVDLLTEGEVETLIGIDGTPNKDAGIYLGDTPLYNVMGSPPGYNFLGTNTDFRPGTAEQTPMDGYPDVETPYQVGIKVNQATPVQQDIADTNVDRVRLTIQIPQLYTQRSDGTTIYNTVLYRIEARYFGGPWVNAVGDQQIQAKCTSPYFRDHEFALPINPSGASAPWSIRLVRISNDTATFNEYNNKGVVSQNDILFQGYTTILDARLAYPHSALVGFSAASVQFGASIPTRRYLGKWRRIQVPANYDPVGRTYGGVWDGSFKIAWTNNPAWIFYDILTDDRFGLGQFIDAAQIDKGSLYQIGAYCDGMVDDGLGTNTREPRLTFNGQIRDQQEAYDLLQLIAQAFRGMPYWSSGLVTASQDRPADAVALVTPANTIDGVFDYQSSARKARHTVALVQWTDPNNLYKPTIEVVEDYDGIARFGYNPITISQPWCTSRGQARRAGLWTLFSDLHETQVVTYKTFLDHATRRPGDIVKIQDPTIADLDYSGRVKRGTTANTVILDRPVTLRPNKPYSITCVLPDGDVQEVAVTNGPGTYTTLNLVAAMAQTPSPGAVWVLASDVQPALYRIISLKENKGGFFEVTALQHEPSKYAVIEDGAPFEPLPISDFPNTVAPPTNLTALENQYFVNGVAKQGILFSWTSGAPFNTSGYYVTVLSPDGATISFPKTSSTSIEITDAQSGHYTFIVSAVGISGVTSSPATLEFDCTGWEGLPTVQVTGLQVQGGGAQFTGKTCSMEWGNTFPDTLPPYPVTNVAYILDPGTQRVLHREVLAVGQTKWAYDYEQNVNDGGPRRSFIVQVSALAVGGGEGGAASLAVSNPAPAAIVPTFQAVSENIFVYAPRPADPDYAGFLTFVSTVSGTDPRTLTPYDTFDTVQILPATPDVTYYIRVAGYDAFGRVDLNYSGEYAVKATILLFDPNPPMIPDKPVLTTAIEVAPDGTATAVVKAAWTQDTSKGFGRYELAFAQHEANTAEQDKGYIFEGTDKAAWERHGFTPGKTISVKVRAGNKDGYPSGYSAVATIVAAKNLTPPAAITAFTVTGAFQNAFLSWTASTSLDIDYTEVWYISGTSSAAAPPSGATLLAKVAARSTSYQDNTLLATGTRTYWLRPVNTSGTAAATYTGPKTATSAAITNAQLAAGVIDATKFAASIAPVAVVASLPTTKTSQFVTLSGDGKLYRWDATANSGAGAYISTVDVTSLDASKVTGQLTSDQIAAIAAAKVSGQLTDAQIAAIATTKLVGQVVASQIESVTAAQISGQLTDAQVAGLAAAKISGTLTSAQIDSIASSKITGQIVATQIASLTAAQISGQLTDAQVAGLAATKLTGSITSTQITDSAVSTAKLAANSVIAGKISAGAITASKLSIATDNLLFNSEFSQTRVDLPTVPLGLSYAVNGSVTVSSTAIRKDYCPSGFTSFSLNFPTTAINGVCDTYIGRVTPDGALNKNFPVIAGVAYEFSAYLSVLYAGNAWIYISFYDGSGAVVSGSGGQSNTVTNGQNGTSPAAWEAAGGRAKLISTAPSGAAYCTLTVRWNAPTSAPSTTPYLFMSGLMFAAISDAQKASGEVSPYTPAGVTTITGSSVLTASLSADRIVAKSITAAQIAANTITASLIAANTITAAQIAASTITATQIAAATLTAREISAGAVTASKLTIGSGNIVFNAGGALTDANGNALGVIPYDGTGQNGGAYILSLRTDNTYPGTYPFCLRPRTIPPVSGTLSHMQLTGLNAAGQPGKAYDVTANATYEMSCYTAAFDGNAVLFVDGLDATTGAGQRLLTLSGPTGGVGTLSRIGGLVKIPANVNKIVFSVGIYWNGGGNPHLFVSAPMIGAAAAGQTELSPWVNSGVTQIDGSNLRTGSIQALQIAARTITAGNLVAGTITATEIAARTITSDVIAAGTIVGGNIAARTIVAGNIVANSITTAEIAARTITATNIVVGTLTGNEIAANSVNADRLVANSITAAKIAAGAISTDQLAAGAITTDKIGVGLSTGNLQWGSDGQVPAAAVSGYVNFTATSLYVGPNGSGPTWQPPQMGSIQCSLQGTPGSASAPLVMDTNIRAPNASNGFEDWMPCVGGQRYEFSAYISTHRCDAYVVIGFIGANDANYVEYNGTVAPYDNQCSGPLNSWWRSTGFAVAPANAQRMRMWVRARLTGGKDPYTFTTGWYLAVAQANQSGFSPWAPQSRTIISGGQLAAYSITGDRIVANTITGGNIAGSTITGGNIAAGTITAGNIATGTLTADMISVGNGSIGSLIGGGNTTKIQGGAIAANTITANLLKIGSRQVNLVGVSFFMERDSNGNINNVLHWTGGYILIQNDNGDPQSFNIPETRIAINGSYWYVWFNPYAPANLGLAQDNWDAVYRDTNNILVATVSGLTGIATLVGGTIIDGTRIVTRSIQADQIAANAIQAIHISAQTITGDKIAASTITADKITSGNLTVGSTITVGTPQTQLWSDGNGGCLRILNRNQDAWRLVAGYLGPWTGDANDFGLIVWGSDNAARVRFSNAMNYIDGVIITDATISNAKIGNLEVDTLKVKDGAISNIVAGSWGGDSGILGITCRSGNSRIAVFGLFRNDPNVSRSNRNPGTMMINWDPNGDSGRRQTIEAVPKNLWILGPNYYWGTTMTMALHSPGAGYHTYSITTNGPYNDSCALFIIEIAK